jgi:hypothetical protein
VRLRPWGRWAAEIHVPYTRHKVWSTFSTTTRGSTRLRDRHTGALVQLTRGTCLSRQWRSHQYGEPWRPHLDVGEPPHPTLIPAGLLAAAQLRCAVAELGNDLLKKIEDRSRYDHGNERPLGPLGFRDGSWWPNATYHADTNRYRLEITPTA